MKYFLTLTLLIASFTAFSQSIDGNWKGSRETPNGTFEVSYTFKTEGTKLTGTWKTQFGESALENGKIDGKKFSFSVSLNDNTISFTGEIISENEITVKNERGETKLARVKQ
ncbi:MAG: hypothetical protein WDN26_11005 [Chitinophagaceae bacterium]